MDDVGVAVVERIPKHDRFNVDNDKLKTSIGIPTLVLDEDGGSIEPQPVDIPTDQDDSDEEEQARFRCFAAE